MNKLVVYLALFCLLCTFGFAKETIISEGERILQIQTPIPDLILINTDYEFNTHVYNKTNGLIMTNKTTSCELHIYNNIGGHIISELMNFSDNDNEFYIKINSSVFTKIGTYNYITQCNTTHTGGFVGYTFEAVNTYETIPYESNISSMTIIIIFLIIIFIILGIFNQFAYFRWAFFIYAFLETVMLTGFIYGSFIGLNIAWLLKFNFYFLIIVGFPIIILSFMLKSVDLMSFGKSAQKDAGTDRFSISKYDDKGLGGDLS